ncbi:DNA-binding transcriptional LysR family regulator [Streptomyces luteogriseus]|uniref:DNA-binding transcriptional LysR family regulator n=1 Tax=Streptomyces luteogriseus TaxID=68233 RepID=A0A7W7DRG8_9ACTN|nr:LysR family transcriptional regulator [Streptomyces luteogriseus]MBB4714854.1 DNA-binding transcriptional LysR family regulator [Streptomyces luteogriseus]
MAAHLDPRLLRGFVTVAEELHFTRAAVRLHVAQQALSRDVRRLERELGTELFVRTTRQVTLTPDGERLLPHARRVLHAQDELLAAFHQPRPLLVDLNSPGLGTPRRVLHEARELAPGHELMARYESGLTGAAGELLAGRLDASFGRFAGLDPALRAGLDHQPVRFEPMAVVLPEDHRLAAWESVPLAELAGESIYAGAGNPRTPEWTGLARLLFEGRDIEIAPPAPLAVGEEEFQRIMARTRNPILAVTEFPALPSTVVRPLVDPVPLSCVSLVWRRGLTHPAFDALRRAAALLSAEMQWLRRPAGSWTPAGDDVFMASHG